MSDLDESFELLELLTEKLRRKILKLKSSPAHPEREIKANELIRVLAELLDVGNKSLSDSPKEGRVS